MGTSSHAIGGSAPRYSSSRPKMRVARKMRKSLISLKRRSMRTTRSTSYCDVPPMPLSTQKRANGVRTSEHTRTGVPVGRWLVGESEAESRLFSHA